MHDGLDPVDDPIRPRELTTIQGKRITIPEPEFRTHLQFRRFAGCPRCSLHLRSIARRHDEILGAGLREVVVLYSSAQAMEPHQGDLPFAGARSGSARVICGLSSGVDSAVAAGLIHEAIADRLTCALDL